MRRRVAEGTSDDLAALPDRCRGCLFWELGTARPIDGEADDLAPDRTAQKISWWETAERGGHGSVEATAVARLLRVGDEEAGFALFGPPRLFAPRRAPIPRPSDDALLLATMWVEPAHRGHGAGRLLLHAVVKEALRTDRRAVEAYGDRRHRERACVLPCTWLLHEGFEVHEEHVRYPLLRLDVRSVLRWPEPLEHALEHALERIGLEPRPSPSPQQTGAAG